MTLSYDELLVKYPKLYADLPYFECEDGWIGLIDELSKKLEEINNKYADFEERIYAVQVKQKFGGLRFYCYTTDNIRKEDHELKDKLIQQAESASYTICEMCSSPATQTKSGGWIMALCEECRTTK
jgi:hypothetical protein